MLLETKSNSTALTVFRNSSKNISGYKKFLKERGFVASSVKNINDFASVPIMDKQNYVLRYDPIELFSNHKFAPFAYASSGSSGKPTFWFRGDAQEEVGGVIHEKIFKDVFNIKKEQSTLVIVCYHMGIWVAGSFTAVSCRYLSRNGYNLTTITPGIEKEDIFNILSTVAPKFKNVVIAGYPPFVSDILFEARERKIQLPKNAFVLTAGDTASESWRSLIMDLLKIKAERVVNAYGSSDFGIMAFETPLVIFIRRQALGSKKFRKILQLEKGVTPAVFQFDQRFIYFEEHQGELLVTADTAMPLIRYNIHDRGAVISYKQITQFLKQSGLYNQAKKHGLDKWQMPIVLKNGRTDVAVTFYALNIYPEYLKAAIDDLRLKKHLSGTYKTFNKDVSDNKKQKLFVHLELAEGKNYSSELQKMAAKIVFEKLLELSNEYKKLYNSIGKQVCPTVKLVPFGNQNILRKEGRALLSIKGKKPRVLA